jgi:hypothetical protein
LLLLLLAAQLRNVGTAAVDHGRSMLLQLFCESVVQHVSVCTQTEA